MEDDTIRIQVVGFPVSIDYIAAEDHYVASQPEDRNGKNYLLADGIMLPLANSGR